MIAANERAAILSDTLVGSRQARDWCFRNIVYYLHFSSTSDGFQLISGEVSV